MWRLGRRSSRILARGDVLGPAGLIHGPEMSMWSRLRAHRRDHRARAPKRRKRRNLVKFIPEADSDFAFVAEHFFLYNLKRDPEAYALQGHEVAEIETAVAGFRTALARLLGKRRRDPELIWRKQAAREYAEEVIRRWANIIRANPNVSDTDKMLIRIKPRPGNLRRKKLPIDPPQLKFLGAGDGVTYEAGVGNGCGVHVLEFRACVTSKITDPDFGKVRRARPDGAARMELFVDLLPLGQPIPHHPAELTGRPWYLGSFTTSRMEVHFPIPSEPMLVVYWGRWADAKGRVGRFSKTCTARVEGWTQNARPALPQGSESPRIETKVVYVQVSRSEPAGLPDYAADDALMDGRRAIEAMEVKRLPEAA